MWDFFQTHLRKQKGLILTSISRFVRLRLQSKFSVKQHGVTSSAFEVTGEKRSLLLRQLCLLTDLNLITIQRGSPTMLIHCGNMT